MPPSNDAEHLKVLSICYYVLAGFQAVGMCVAVGALLFIMSVGTVVAAHDHNGPPAALFPVLFGGVACFVFLIVGAQVLLNFLAARGLQERRRRALIFVAAALNCLHIPFGLTLGIFTFTIMGRPNVQTMFDASRAPQYRA